MAINDNVLEKIIFDIENSSYETIEKKLKNETFELWSDPVILSNLSGNIGAIFVRAILKKLNVNEHHVFKWRLENKHRQYQILNHYVPDCMAKTFGFSQVLSENNGVQKIRELCNNGFFIKCTLGHRTGITNSFDRSDELDEIIRSHQEHSYLEEKWVLQEKLDLNQEFRIHSFGKDLISGLTFIMEGVDSDSSKSYNAEKLVKNILEKLPDTILQGTLIGWDIGVTNANLYYVIEANFTGFHPEFHRGFQTSGYFGDPDYGPILCAWLNNYFRNRYQVSINSIENDLLSTNKFYREFMFYAPLFNNEHIQILNNKEKGIIATAFIYLGMEIDSRLIKLTKYFWQEDFAKIYYLIVSEKHLLTVMHLFPGNDFVKIIVEDNLFTNDEYLRIQKLSYEKRKDICCQHVISVLKEKIYFIV